MATNTVEIKFLGDNTDLSKKLTTMGTKLGDFAKKAAKVGALAGVAAGAGLVKLGLSLDSAMDNIIVGTGASGDALEGLRSSFENVAGSVPSSFADVSTAIADVNTRLGLTGQPLEDLSTKFLDLSRLTGTDVATNISNMSRVFGDAGVAAEDQGLALDKLFAASQASGIGLDALSTTLVNFGAPMRQLGFSLDESTALLAKFDKEGVNTEAVLAGMKAGLGKMAKAGEDPIDTFDRLVESIKGAGSQGEANSIALEAFGQRAGPDMAAAIREGRFEIDDYMDVLDGAEGVIGDTADATESWTEKLKVLANKAMIKIAPLAEKAFGAIEKGVEAVTPHIETMVEWLSEKVPPVLRRLNTWFDKTRAAITSAMSWISENRGPIIGALSAVAIGVTALLVPAFVAWAVSAGAAAVATIAAAAPFIALGAAVAAIGAGLVWAYQNVDFFRAAVDKAWQLLKTGFNVTLAASKVVIDKVWSAIKVASSWLADMWTKTEDLRSLIASGFKKALEIGKKGIDFLWGATETLAGWLQTGWEKTENLRSLAAGGFKQGLDNAKTTIDFLWGALKTTASWLQTAWTKTENLRALAAAGFKTSIDNAKTTITLFWGAVQKTASWLQSAWTKTENLRSLMALGFKTAVNNIRISVTSAWGALKTLSNWLQTAWTKSDTLRSLFVGGFKTAINGIKSAFNFAKSAATSLANAIQSVINKANSAKNAVSSIPGAGAIGGAIGGIFHDGGYVGGSPNAPARDIPIIAQGGEYVMSREEVAAARSRGPGVGNSAGGGGMVIELHLSDDRRIRAIVDQRDEEIAMSLDNGLRAA